MLKRTSFGTAASFAGVPLAERRVSGRIRVFDPGKLLCTPGAPAIDCMITDISPTGAGVLSSVDPELVPKAMICLVYLQRRIAYDAFATWSERDRLGLRFAGEHDLLKPENETFEAMSRLCREH